LNDLLKTYCIDAVAIETSPYLGCQMTAHAIFRTLNEDHKGLSYRINPSAGEKTSHDKIFKSDLSEGSLVCEKLDMESFRSIYLPEIKIIQIEATNIRDSMTSDRWGSSLDQSFRLGQLIESYIMSGRESAKRTAFIVVTNIFNV
jgi:hypothetical protein